MDQLDGVTSDDLRRALDQVEGSLPTQRLLAAIAHENGVSQTDLAAWHGVSRRTIYNWLDRIEPGAIAESVTDEPRPGRPRELAESERERAVEALQRPPAESGYDEPAWTTALVQRWVREEFGTAYSLPSCRRLLRAAGLVYRRAPREQADGADHVPAGGGWVLREAE